MVGLGRWLGACIAAAILASPVPRACAQSARTIKLLDFNEGDAVDQQLHHWLINSAFRGTPDLLYVSACVIDQGNQLIELLNQARLRGGMAPRLYVSPGDDQ